MASQYHLRDKVVVITGAGSGIGRQLALQFASRGCRLALSDINEKGLQETAAMLPAPALLEKLDVADRAAFFAFASRVAAELGTAHVIVNNAGVTVSQSIRDHSLDDYQWLMNINFWGVVHGTQAFLPTFLAQRDGYVVNISSIYGLVGWPTQSAYCASKFAVRGFTECLHSELDGTGVRALQVHPGGVKTNIVRNQRFRSTATGETSNAALAKSFDQVAMTTPESAAAKIVAAVEKGRQRLVVGGDAKLLDQIARWFPASYTGLIKRAVKMGARRVQARKAKELQA